MCVCLAVYVYVHTKGERSYRKTLRAPVARAKAICHKRPLSPGRKRPLQYVVLQIKLQEVQVHGNNLLQAEVQESLLSKLFTLKISEMQLHKQVQDNDGITVLTLT